MNPINKLDGTRDCGGHLTVVTGPMFSGKCLLKQTLVLMHSGYIKKVEDVVVGDILMGDDSTPRKVLNVCSGIGPIFRVMGSDGTNYYVNDRHILTVKQNNKILDIPVTEVDDSLYGYRVPVNFSKKKIEIDPFIFGKWIMRNEEEIPDKYLLNTKNIRTLLLRGIISKSKVIKVKNKLLVSQIQYLARSLGFLVDIIPGEETIIRVTEGNLDYKIKVVPHGEDVYYGFELDGNGRFLLSDFTVTHNSSELQRQIKRMKISGKKCLLIKHEIDNRYSNNECCTHDLHSMSALAVSSLWDAYEKCKDYQVIGIDEGQFFPEIVGFVNQLVDNDGKIVIVAALDSTFEGKPFGTIHELLANSEQFIKLTAICQDCGSDASFTVKKNSSNNIIEVGAADLYLPVCRKCRKKRNSFFYEMF
jgi:thymidine kinase